MNEIEQALYRTRKTLHQAFEDAGAEYDEDFPISEIQECSSCSIWLKHFELKPDLDGNPVCRPCLDWYGM